MAVRYSGDTEVRLGYDVKRGVYRGTVRDPYKRWRGEVRVRGRGSEGYDRAAEEMIQAAERRVGKLQCDRRRGRPEVRRVFQAPCPKGMTS